MAHSANVVHGNYILFFGGYCTETKQYLNNNFSALSLMGCTDYIFSQPNTMAMIREAFLAKAYDKVNMKQQIV